MTAADIYLAALREAAGLPPEEQKQKRSAGKEQKQKRRPKPKRLAGGCLLYVLASYRKRARNDD